jgi:hypothetical protein
MAQVFGNRILGGVGAPGGGMSQAYAEGVGLRLDQRRARQAMDETAQAMRMRDIELQWATEDREEAKRQRAAAAAAAAAAKAREAALAKELLATVNTSAPGLAVPPGQTFGPRVSVGGDTPMLPPSARPAAPTVGVRPSAPLSFGVSGGGGADVTRGGPGADILGAPAGGPSFERVGREVGAASASDMAATAAARAAMVTPTAQPAAAPLRPGFGRAVTGLEGGTNGFQQLMDVLTTRTGRTAEESAAAPIAGPSFEDAGRGVGVTSPAAPAAPVAATTPAAAVAAAQYPIGQYPTAPTAQLSFGPQLGAIEADPNASVAAKVEANPPGQAQPTPNAELYIMEPGRPGRELQQAMDLRAQYVQAAQIYEKYGDYAAVRDLYSKIQELDSTLYYLQGMQGLQELQFNSPQRLTMVLSEQLGRNIGIQPNAEGGYDIYVDGQLAMKKDAGGGENSVGYWARSLLDTNFAQAEAARADEYNKLRYEAEIDVAKQTAIDANKAANDEWLKRVDADIAAEKALLDARLNPNAIELQVDENTSEVLVYDKVNRQMLGVITRADPLNPEVPLSQPTFVPAQ